MADESQGRVVEIVLDAHAFKPYHYTLPDELADRAEPGMRALVPFGPRKMTGYIMGYGEAPEGIKLKKVIDILDEVPLFDEQMKELLEFASRYLFFPLGEAIRGALPAGINIESRQRVQITEGGELAQQSGLIRGPKAELLSLLELGKDYPQQKVLKQVKGIKHYHLQELVRDGFLELKNSLTKPRNRLKLKRFYQAVAGISTARRSAMVKRSPKQARVLSYVERAGVVRSDVLRQDLGTNMSDAIRALLKKGLLDVEEREVISDPFFSPVEEKRKPRLTETQQGVMSRVLPGLEAQKFQPFLLHGVTGSGKTEIYIRLIERVLELGREAIVLVPEISLTPQFVANFRARLGDALTVLHSGLREQERLTQWWRIHRGEVSIVIGARSAIFAPFKNLGAIVVDEEHESSYKQEGRFPYNARSLALMRGKLSNATVLLGSATPSLESYNLAQQNKWGYLHLPHRIQHRPMPEIEVVDLRQVDQRIGGILSPALVKRIEQNIESKGQTILLLNRRGYRTSVICGACGYSFHCVHCSVGMTYHRQESMMLCHYCGHAEQLPNCCPKCGTEELEFLGQGTEKVEELLRDVFPQARVERMDRDTTSGRGAMEALVGRMSRGEIDILIGTQMVAKGHDFPNVTLVGVLMADFGMNMPDFRSAERTFQLLTQVAGRAGRGEKPGWVVIQTFNPEHASIVHACSHDFEGFYQQEMPMRQELGYPPFGRLILLRFEGEDPDQTRQQAEHIGQLTARLLRSNDFPGVVKLGPVPSPIERIKRKFRWQMLLKGVERQSLHALVRSLYPELLQAQGRGGVKIMVDTDPIQML